MSDGRRRVVEWSAHAQPTTYLPLLSTYLQQQLHTVAVGGDCDLDYRERAYPQGIVARAEGAPGPPCPPEWYSKGTSKVVCQSDQDHWLCCFAHARLDGMWLNGHEGSDGGGVTGPLETRQSLRLWAELPPSSAGVLYDGTNNSQAQVKEH